MPRAKEVVDKTDDEKTLLEIENINPNKKKSKKIKELVVAKEDKVEPKKDKAKPKPKEQKDMTEKELIKELKLKDKEIDRIKKMVLKMNEIIE